MSLWLNLIPQLHRPGDSDDVSMRHHHFQEEGDQFYDGIKCPFKIVDMLFDGFATHSRILFIFSLVFSFKQ